jgi:acyl dehydratase
MTRPAAIRPKEGQQPGTPFERFHPGDPLAPMSFTLDADVVDEYTRLLGGDLDWYHAPPEAMGPLAPATTPALFLLALLYRTFPPVQGLVLTHQEFAFIEPWAPGMSITGTGTIVETAVRRGRPYVTWAARFNDDATGRLLTTARNTFTLPPEERQATTPDMRLPGPEPADGVPVTPVRLKQPVTIEPGARLDCAEGLRMSQALIDWYGRLNGDHDVVHYDEPYAHALGYRAPIAHGLMIAGYLSELLRAAFDLRWLAGGALAIKWSAPVYPDDIIYPSAEIAPPAEGRLPLRVHCENAEGQPVLVGAASVPA